MKGSALLTANPTGSNTERPGTLTRAGSAEATIAARIIVGRDVPLVLNADGLRDVGMAVDIAGRRTSTCVWRSFIGRFRCSRRLQLRLLFMTADIRVCRMS
jgi:hypothetical protein